MMTDITCRIIVMKGNEFYSGSCKYGDKMIYRFSPHMYDARRFRTLEKAHNKAKAIGGRVRLMDHLNGELI